MNRRTIRLAVRHRLGITAAGDGMISEAFMDDAINEALRRVSKDRRWPWLIMQASMSFTVGNAGIVALPTGYMAAKHLTITGTSGTRVAKYLPLSEFLDTEARQTELIRHVWTVSGVNIQLSPAPTVTTAGTLHYYGVEPDLTTDDGEPLMPDAYHDVVVAFATYICALRRQDEGRAQNYLSDAQTQLNDIEKVAVIRPQPRSVRQTAYAAELGRYASWT